MKTNKTDHRSKYTQMTIKQNLMKLMNKKSLNKITVAELCAKAEINRGTFYNHFYDVFDVYDNIEQELYNEVKQKLESTESYFGASIFFEEIMELIQKNADIVSVILIDKDNSGFLKRIIAFAKKRYITELLESSLKVSEQMAQYIFSYTMNGSIGLLTDWVKNGTKESPKEIANLIQEFNRMHMDKLVKNYPNPNR